jgi:hypothetical protein
VIVGLPRKVPRKGTPRNRDNREKGTEKGAEKRDSREKGLFGGGGTPAPEQALFSLSVLARFWSELRGIAIHDSRP